MEEKANIGQFFEAENGMNSPKIIGGDGME